MFFAQYIQLLHRHISQGMIQPDFTEDFLCHATDKIKKGDYSTSSYKRFFAGKTQGTGSEKRIIGDTIGPFAIKHLKINENEYKTRQSLLQAYLSEMIEKADAASQLANAFREEIPAISSVDITEMAKKLSDLYFEIINRAINDVSHSKGSSLQEPNHEVDAIPAAVRTNINEKINEIILLIDVMLQFGKDFVEWQRRNTMSTPYSQCVSWQKLQDKYDRYNNLNIELRTLCQKYHIDLLESSFQLSKQFSINSFWRCYPVRYLPTLDTLETIQDYKRILFSISAMLEKSLMM